MSIVFPPNPSLGQTITYSNITWEYNGFGWNKLTYIPDPLYIEHLNVDFIDFDTTVVGITQQDGRMYWDSNLHTVVLGMTGGINTAIGQSLYKFAHNGSGGPINKGQVVYISGGHASTSLNIELANATSETTAATTIGVAAENIANGADGFIITQGLLLGVDTNTFSPSDEGKILWLAETDGAFTLTRPQAPSHGVVVGWLVKKAGAGAGSIFVKISNGQEFYELHDVRFTGLTTDNIPAYKGASGIWVNRSLSDLNVARTNQGNTFSVRQVMSGGITTANLFVVEGATFNSRIGFVDGTTQSTAWRSNIFGGKLSPGDGNIVVQADGVYSTTVAGTCRFGPTGSFMMNLSPFTFNRGVTLTTLYTYQNADTGNTGSFKFVVYQPGPTTGLPFNRLYESSTINIPTTITTHTVSPDIRLEMGTYWMGVLISIPSGKTLNTDRYNWSIVNGQANQWTAVNGNRFFNAGDFNHLRYRLDGMTAYNPLTYGFTSSLTNNTDPAIGFGTSETVGAQRTMWIGASIR
jgi:hypothetical protein